MNSQPKINMKRCHFGLNCSKIPTCGFMHAGEAETTYDTPVLCTKTGHCTCGNAHSKNEYMIRINIKNKEIERKKQVADIQAQIDEFARRGMEIEQEKKREQEEREQQFAEVKKRHEREIAEALARADAMKNIRESAPEPTPICDPVYLMRSTIEMLPPAQRDVIYAGLEAALGKIDNKQKELRTRADAETAKVNALEARLREMEAALANANQEIADLKVELDHADYADAENQKTINKLKIDAERYQNLIKNCPENIRIQDDRVETARGFALCECGARFGIASHGDELCPQCFYNARSASFERASRGRMILEKFTEMMQ